MRCRFIREKRATWKTLLLSGETSCESSHGARVISTAMQFCSVWPIVDETLFSGTHFWADIINVVLLFIWELVLDDHRAHWSEGSTLRVRGHCSVRSSCWCGDASWSEIGFWLSGEHFHSKGMRIIKIEKKLFVRNLFRINYLSFYSSHEVFFFFHCSKCILLLRWQLRLY